jgi:hypothetical protein
LRAEGNPTPAEVEIMGHFRRLLGLARGAVLLTYRDLNDLPGDEMTLDVMRLRARRMQALRRDAGALGMDPRKLHDILRRVEIRRGYDA